MNKTKTHKRFDSLGRPLLCSMPNCEGHVKAKGLCDRHIQRLYRGTLIKELIKFSFICENNVEHDYKSDCRCFRKDRPKVRSYDGQHGYIRKMRGVAKDQLCIVTDDKRGFHPAQEWALQVEPTHFSPRPTKAGKIVDYGYSLDVNDYAPMCCYHHRYADGNEDQLFTAIDNPLNRNEEE